MQLLSEKDADRRLDFWLNGRVVTVQLPAQVQDLVLWMHSRWVFEVPAAELEELGDALLAGVDDPRLHEIEARLVGRVWTPELEKDIDDALAELELEADHCRHMVERARLDLELRHHASAIAQELLRQIAYQSAHDRLPFMFCLDCLEERMGKLPGERRATALQVAPLAWSDAGIREEELREAIRRSRLHPAAVPVLLATDARRSAVRARLRRVADFSSRRQPQLSRELRRILAEPLPADPREDELWVELCRGLADWQLLPELN